MGRRLRHGYTAGRGGLCMVNDQSLCLSRLSLIQLGSQPPGSAPLYAVRVCSATGAYCIQDALAAPAALLCESGACSRAVVSRWGVMGRTLGSSMCRKLP